MDTVLTLFFQPIFWGCNAVSIANNLCSEILQFLGLLQSIICVFERGYDGASRVSKNLDKQMDKVWIKLG